MRIAIPGLLTVALCAIASSASARFVSADPVQADPNTGANYNRYWYGNNNPYSFTDPDGRLSRGTGWTDRQWNQFDRAQQSAAGSLEKAAGKINGALAEGGKALQRAEKSFQRNFGAGSATPENMAKAASDMSSMAAALRDTSAGAIPANGMTGAQINAAYGVGADTLGGRAFHRAENGHRQHHARQFQ